MKLQRETAIEFPAARRLRLPRSYDAVQFTVAAVVIAFLIYQVVTPLLFLVWGSFKTTRPGAIGFFSLDVTLSNYVRAVTQGQFAAALFNSFVYAFAAAFGALALAIPLAWITERTNAPARSAIYGLSIVGLVVPGILPAVAWIFLASPNIGLLNKAAIALGFNGPPFNIFSLGGMIWVSIWQYLPMAFLLMSAAFQSMDPNLEEASAMSGHGVARTTCA